MTSTALSSPLTVNPHQTSIDPSVSARWQAVLARDPESDGAFVYAVRTTGIYCRPTCPARRPKPTNVEYFADCPAAVRAGYRACKRCRPDAPTRGGAADPLTPAAERAARVAALCRLIEASEATPSLRALGAHIGLSPHHTQRLFKSETGVTPAAYAAAVRAGTVRAALRSGAKVTEAIHTAGYGSSSRFYEKSTALLGMEPGEYRSGAPGVVIHFAVGACSLGAVLVAATVRGVTAILLGDEPEALVHELQDRFPRAELVGADSDFERVIAKVIGLIEDPRRGVDLPLDVQGTAFQQRVWQALRAIPAGATTTYTELAQTLGRPSAVRAVASACAANPCAVAVPCHRVVRKDGGLAGYRWGIERKAELLRREGESG